MSDTSTGVTAFLVVVPDDQPPYALTDLETLPTLTRQMTLPEIRRAAADLVADLTAQAAASYVMLGLKQIAEAKVAAEKQPAERVSGALKRRKK